jgi:hypothetical protein
LHLFKINANIIRNIMKNKLFALALLFGLFSCSQTSDVGSQTQELKVSPEVSEEEVNTFVSKSNESRTLDPEVDQLRVDFARACVFPSYTCKLANPLNDVYREEDSGMPIAVPFGSTSSLPQSWVAKWCAATTPSKVHVDYVRYPKDQTEKRVWACVMDDYSPGATK